MTQLKCSISLLKFKHRYYKALSTPGVIGVQLTDLTLTKDLKEFLVNEGLYNLCVQTVHVLRGNKMIKIDDLKEELFIHD